MALNNFEVRGVAKPGEPLPNMVRVEFFRDDDGRLHVYALDPDGKSFRQGTRHQVAEWLQANRYSHHGENGVWVR